MNMNEMVTKNKAEVMSFIKYLCPRTKRGEMEEIMSKINLKMYKKVDDFPKIYIDDVINVNEAEFVRLAITVGGFSGHAVSLRGSLFYKALVKMALNFGTNVTQDKDYIMSEQSIKTNISFFMGMFAAKIVSSKIHGITHLYHMKDKRLIYNQNKGENKIPDFFGVSGSVTNPKVYLFEAKGTGTETGLKNSTIKNGRNQVAAIKSVELIFSGEKFSDFEKYVIGADFNEKRELTYHQVDPVEKGDLMINFDIHLAMVLYYENIMKLLLSEEPTKDLNSKHHSVDYSKYTLARVGEYLIGLDKYIYQELNQYRLFYLENGDIEQLDRESLFKTYKLISQITSNNKDGIYEENVSSCLDGIICFKYSSLN